VTKFTIELEIGLSFFLESALPLDILPGHVANPSDRSHVPDIAVGSVLVVVVEPVWQRSGAVGARAVGQP
jgi:hypothetical protein